MGRRSSTLLVLLAYLGLAVFLLKDAWRAPLTVAAGFGPDLALFIWYLRWVPFAISHGLNPLLSTYLDYPAGINLMWNTSILLPATLMAPVTIALGPVASYNSLVTLALGGSAWSAFLVFRRYVRSGLAAATGGLLFGFSPFMLSQSLGHLHTTLAFTPPLILLLLDDLLVRQDRPAPVTGALLGLVAALQLLTGEELLATEALAALLGIAILAGEFRPLIGIKAPHALRGAGVALGVFLMLAGIPLATQFLGPDRVLGPIASHNVFVSDLAGFVLPSPLQQLGPPSGLSIASRFSGTPYESGAFLGPGLIGLLAWVSRRFWERPVVRLASLLTLTCALLSLGPTLHVASVTTPIPVAVLALPMVGLMRARGGRFLPATFLLASLALPLAPVLDDIVPARLMLYAFLFGGLLLAVLVDKLVAGPERGRALGVAAVGLALLMLLPRWPFPSTAIPMPGFFAGGAVDVPAGSTALLAPYGYAFNPLSMLWQAGAGMRFRMPEGYALIPGPSFSPPPSAVGNALTVIELGRPGPTLTRGTREQMLGELRKLAVRTVIVGPMAHQNEVAALFQELLGRNPEVTGGVLLWRNVAP